MSSDKYNRNLKSLEQSESPIVRDACLQRFEFCYELLWKTLKVFLEDIHGVRAVSPRQVFKEAFALSLIEKEQIFIEMIESRNTLAHTYNEEQAMKIYTKCSDYLSVMKSVLAQLNKQT